MVPQIRTGIKTAQKNACQKVAIPARRGALAAQKQRPASGNQNRKRYASGCVDQPGAKIPAKNATGKSHIGKKERQCWRPMAMRESRDAEAFIAAV